MQKLLLLLVCSSLLNIATAQKEISFEDKIKGMEAMPGYFPLYWDEKEGKLWMEIDTTGVEFLYQTSLPAGLGSNDIGLDRGLLGETAVVKYEKAGPKLLLTQTNYKYRASSTALPEQNAVSQSFAESVLWGFTIGFQSGNRLLVDATDFFLRDAMDVIDKLKQMKQGVFVFNASRSAIYTPRTKNFPINTEVEASITFVLKEGQAGSLVRSVAPSNEAFTVRMHHSFVQLPDNNYNKRVFDPRSGYYPVSYYDFSTPVSEPIDKYFIARHRLQRKDPAALLSEAVEPIIYYVDNGTPEPIRSALVEGASWWNQAFEAAGFRNAFQVKILPDTADPMDARYNVINWVHRSTRGWSYGASITDPRTGEIIKGHVTLGSLRVRQDYLIASGLLAPFEEGKPVDPRMMAMALARLKQLAAHEVGHTLGLMHNYAASTRGRVSVMDYPSPLVTLDSSGNIDLSQAYDDKIGEWDKQAIKWGYSEFANTDAEKVGLAAIMNETIRRNLLFITDRDARAAGGLHPDAHLWDNAADVVSELQTTLAVRKKALEQFGENNIRKDVPLAMLEDVLVPIYFYHRYQQEAAVKWIGGMYYTYAVKGDGQTITKELPRTEQQRAMQVLLQSMDPSALVIPQRILSMIPPRPSGYMPSGELFNKRTGIAFDALSPAETAVDVPLSFLFNDDRISRLVTNAATGNYSLQDMIHDLMEATWNSSRRTGMEKLIQLQTEQLLLSYLMALSLDQKVPFEARAIATRTLEQLKEELEKRNKKEKDSDLLAHYSLALLRMKKPEDAQTATASPEIPPGSPIGECDLF